MSNHDEQFSNSINELNELKSSFELALKNRVKFSTLKKIFKDIKILELKIKYREIVDSKRQQKALANRERHGYYNKRFTNGDDYQKLL